MVQAGQEEVAKLAPQSFVERLSAKLESLELVVATLQGESTEARAAQVALEDRVDAQEQQLHAQQRKIIELQRTKQEMEQRLQMQQEQLAELQKELVAEKAAGLSPVSKIVGARAERGDG